MANNGRGTHLQAGQPIYWVWQAMKRHCYNKNDRSYRYVGGLGVKVYEPWLIDFPTWLDDVGDRPSAKPVLDRINLFKDYQPGNTRWSTSIEARIHRLNHIDLLYERSLHVKLMEKYCFQQAAKEWRRVLALGSRRLAHKEWALFDTFIKDVGTPPRPYARLVKKDYRFVHSPDNAVWSLRANGRSSEEDDS